MSLGLELFWVGVWLRKQCGLVILLCFCVSFVRLSYVDGTFIGLALLACIGIPIGMSNYFNTYLIS
jgi:hypothetical protein